jgi:DNA mismatch repair ATPase MutS
MGISVSLFRFLNIARISAQMTPQLLANVGILPRAIMHLKKLGPYLWFFLYFQGVYSIVTSALELNKINKKIHEKVNGVINYLEESINIMNELEKYGIKFTSKNKIEQFLINKKTNDYSIVFDQGHYLINFKQISISQNDITQIVIDIGHIDSLFSISKLLFLPNLQFSTPNYINENKILCKGMFHPSIGFNRSIKNDINFDGNIILTGPNGSGKSTIVKGIGLCVLFSQTITLVNAEYANIPIFSYINTYLNIPDCQGKESLFQAELRRCLYNIKKIQSLSSNQKSFLLMDEIFTGTNFKEGLSAAYSICKYLSKINNNLTLITTHYKLLTSIEKKFPWPNGYKNFKMILNKDNTYTYSLKEGISDIMMAIDMMESYGFPDNVVKDARFIVKKLNKKNYI